MNQQFSDVTVIIPSLNPDDKLAKTVADLIESGFTDIVLVNDGSDAKYDSFFPADHPECTVLKHDVNRGKGAALKTAYNFILERDKSIAGVVTVDGDGQHKAEDVLQCAHTMLECDSIVLGVRDFSQEDIPLRSRVGNKATRMVFRLFCGLKVSDTQTGLRAFPYRYLAPMAAIEGDRYEYETNALLHLNAMSVPFAEVKISTVYIENNQTSHFRPLRDSLRIYGLILRFLAASILSSLVDLGLFFLLSCFLPGILGAAADAACTLIARGVSSLVNFSLNKRKVFKSNGDTSTALVRYYILAAGIVILSSLSITAVSFLFGMHDGSFAFIKTVCKFVIDALLFILSFRVQQKWVFANKKSD